ncbi:MAG: hypothetical protein ACI4BA_07980 [Prevotella sp.]
MDRFFRLFIAFLFVAVSSLSFVSCGSDDDPGSGSQADEEETYTVYYVAVIARDNFEVGTVEFSALDPVSNKTISYTLPDNGTDDWNNEAITSHVPLLGSVDKNVYMLRSVVIPNVKKGMNYNASAVLKLDRSKLEQMDKDKSITLYESVVLTNIVSSKGTSYLSQYELNLDISESEVGKLLDDFDTVYEYYMQVASIVNGKIQ